MDNNHESTKNDFPFPFRVFQISCFRDEFFIFVFDLAFPG